MAIYLYLQMFKLFYNRKKRNEKHKRNIEEPTFDFCSLSFRVALKRIFKNEMNCKSTRIGE